MATPTCALTLNQIEALYRAVLGKVITDKNKDIKHDPETFMKDLYVMLKNAPGGSESTAMDYIQHVPRMLNTAQSTIEEVSDYIMDSGISLDKINKLRRDFKDIENVKKFLNPDVNPVTETLKEIIKESLPATGVLSTDGYTKIENTDKEKKSKISSQNKFEATPETALAQLNQEAQDYGGVEAKQNIPDPDPKKQTYYKVVRKINDILGKLGLQNADTLEMGNITGIFLTAMKASDIPVEDLYVSHQNYFNNDDLSTNKNGKTSEQKLEERKKGDQLVLVYTDKIGKIIYFNTDGGISTKDAGGTIAYSGVRRVYTDSSGNKSVDKVQSIEDLAGKPAARTKAQLQEARDTEIQILEKMKDFVLKNPTTPLLFSVTPGKNGYVKEDFSVRNHIADIEMDNGFTPYYSSSDDAVKIKGGVYFNVPGYDLPLLIQRPKFSEVPDFVENLATYLFDSSIPAYDKITVLRQFAQSTETSIIEENDKLFIKQGDDLLDVSDKTNREKFITNLTTQTININKDLLNNNYRALIKNTEGNIEVQNKNYNNFIAQNFYTNLQKNDQGKIVQLNAYNVIHPTADASEKMFKVAKKPFERENTPPTRDAKGNVISKQSVSGFKADIENSEIEKIRYKDKAKRIRIDYPTEIEGIPTEFLLEYVEQDFGEDVIAWEDDADLDKLEQQYGKAVRDLLEDNQEISKKEAEWLKSKGEAAVNYVNELIDYYPEDDSNFNVSDSKETAEWLLNQNEKLVDTAQMSLFGVYDVNQATPTDITMEQLKEKLKNSGRLLKEVGLSSEATDEQIKTAEKWWKGHPMSQFIPFQDLFNIINSNARAEFTMAGITLFAGSNFTDVYHESWHAFSQMYLTREDKVKLYNEARKLSGSFTTVKGTTVKFSEATDIQLEEFMAEDFRKYVLSDGTKIIEGRSTRNTIFKRIYNFLKALFSGQSYNSIMANQKAVGTIKELYDQLYLGDINDYTPSINNVQFSLLNKGMQSLNANANENVGLNYQDSITLTQSIDSIMANILTDLGISVGTIFTDPIGMESIYYMVRNNLASLKNNLEPNSNGAAIIDFAISNWGDYRKVATGEQKTGVLAFHKLKSEFITFDEKYAEMSPIEKDINDEVKDPTQVEDGALNKSESELREQFGQNAFERKGNENSIVSIASNETVYLIKSLPKVGKENTNSLGASKLVDFNKTWGIVINAVAGAINKTEMYNKLVEAAKIHPELQELINRLQDPNTKVDNNTDAAYYHMWTKFFRDFSVYKIPITEVQVIKKLGENGENAGFEVRFVEADPTVLQVERNFINSFETDKVSEFITKNSEGVNVLNVSKVFNTFSPDSLSKPDNAFNFLRAIGFNLTDNQAVRQELSKHTKAVEVLFNRLLKLDNDNKVITNPLRSLSEKYTEIKGKETRETSETGRVREILLVEALHSSKYSNNSVTNVNGDQEYELSLNNSITQLLKELNDQSKSYTEIVSQPHMAHLNVENNPAAKYSVILNSLFEIQLAHTEINQSNKGQRKNTSKDKVTNATIDLVNLGGIKSMIQELEKAMTVGDGLKTTKLDINSKFLMDLHTMLEAGVMELTRRASKSSAFGISASQVSTKFNTNDKTSYISTGLFADPIASMNAAAELLSDKIAAEMERIAIVKTGEFDNIPGFKDRGLTFTMFDDILTDDLQADLIKVADKNDSHSIVNSLEFKKRILKDVTNYLNNLYEENMELYREMPFLSKEMMTKIDTLTAKDGTKAKNTLKLREAEEIAIKSFTFNALFHNMEMLALVDGDLAMFNHAKEEYHKRNTYVTSTGRVFSTDISDIQFINNLLKGNTYANKINAEKRSFSNVLNSVVFKDNKVKSAYYDEYLEALTKKYGLEKATAILKNYNKSGEDKGMVEGDGQGWITFDTYRVLSLIESNWSPEQNELYHKVINEEEIDPKTLTEFFPPRKYQYGGPLQTNKLHIAGFHKFSLLPLIPSLIKGTNLETIHNNMVNQGVDYAMFESGSKLATITKDGKSDSFYEGDDYDSRVVKTWNKGDEMYTKNPIFLQYLKNQVDINSKWKNKTIFSTQLRKLIINDLFRQGLPITAEFGNLVNKFEEQLETLQNFKKQELLEEMGWTKDAEGKLTGDKRKLVDFLRKELARQGASDHLIEFIDLNENGELKNDLSYSLEAEKIEKLLNAVVVKRLIRQKVNGEQLVQASGAGFESSDRTKFSKASEEDIKKYMGTNGLPTYRPGKGKDGKTTAMKVKIAMKGDYYKLLELNSVKDLARKDNISPLEALNKLLRSDKWLDKDDNRKLVTMVGVRVPVQGLNSMEFMEVYEFLPEVSSNIIIVPSEIVAKSGGDFDIDKLTIFQPNYAKSKKHAEYSIKENVKGTENKIIETIREILEHPENFDTLIRPNDTDLTKGVADELSKENIHGYDRFKNKTNPTRTNKNGESVISPTRTLEPRYNLFKHESNNVGKDTLGIGAVDNSYSSIFKRIGAHLQNQYTFKVWDKKKNDWKTHTRNVNIAMEHNTMEKDGKTFISLSDISTKTLDKVSDLISQLMNGWVDVEKDAWIFNINGNKVAGPVLLFLLESGVDFKTAAYFVSQPLVVDYIKERTRNDSPFYEAAGKGVNEGKGLNKFNIRKEFIEKTFDVQGSLDFLSAKKMYSEYIQPATKNKKFTAKELLDSIKSKDKTTDIAKNTLMHFFELEDMMRDLTNVKLTLNVDTSPAKSSFAAQTKLIKIEGLNTTDIVSQENINDIKTKSPIASFFIQKFQLLLTKPFMKLRSDEKVNNYLIDVVKNNKHISTFEDAEKFAAAFKNDIPLYILQNHLKSLDIDKITEYNSLKISKNLPVKEVQMRNGAFVKDGVMYIDKDQIQNDFSSKAYAGEGYRTLGLQVVSNKTFNMSPNQNVNFQEYAHFVLEREYLRSITKVTDGQSREAYEKEITNNALNRTFNFYTLLKSPVNVADQFMAIKKNKKYKSFVDNYMIFDQLKSSAISSDKSIKVLQLKSSKLDTDLTNILEENLSRLADVNTIKVADKAENQIISRFFSRMIVSEYLRNGVTKTKDSLAPILPPDMLMRLIQEPMKNLEKTGITDKMLKNYFEIFNSNWASSKKDTRNKFRNYIQSTEPLVESKAAEPRNMISQDKNGVNLFTNAYLKSEVEPLLSANPQISFVYLNNEFNKSNAISAAFNKANSIGIDVKSNDASYDDNIKTITKSLDLIEDRASNGSDIAFPKDGLTMTKTKEMYADVLRDKAPRTFEFLATELAKRFGYIHPGAEDILGVREVVQASQPISDVEIQDTIKQKFEESKNCNG